jgi:hypothetical protein
LEIGAVSHGDEYIIHNFYIVEAKIRHRLSEDMDVDVEIRKINGGLWSYQDELKAREFEHEDYDNTPGDEQYAVQQSLGRETVFQLVPGDKEGATMPFFDELILALEKTVKKMKFKVSRSESYTNVGDGTVIVSIFSKGSVVLVWDGRGHVGVNLFNFNDRQELADSFVSSFVHFSGKNLKVGLRDDFPRGTGRVVNFRNDMTKMSARAIASK